MNAITVRNLPPDVVKAVKEKARREKLSLNRAIVAIHDYLRRQGTSVSPNDLWIAASAGQHGLTIVTLNGDFDRIPQVLVRKLGSPP